MSKLLSLHRPTEISKLASLVPEHGEAYPSGANVPPQWLDLDLSQKLPDRRNPSVPAKQLSRRSLANPLWHLPHGHGFNLTDPLMQITRRTYHPLHDEHLQRFWRDTFKRNLTERGLIDDDGKVVCSLQEFNQWRAFLFQQFQMSLKRCLQAEESQRHLKSHNADTLDHLGRFGDHEEKLAVICKRAKLLFQRKISEWKKSIEAYRYRTDTFANQQNLRRRQYRKEASRRDFVQRFRNEELCAQRRTNSLHMKCKLRERDALVQQRLRNNRMRNVMIKATLNQEKFNMHCCAYLREKAKNNELLKNHLAEMELRVQRRKELLNEQHTKLDEELNHRKAANVCKRYDRRNRDALVKTILSQCRSHIRAKYPDSSQLEPKTVAQAVNAALTIHTVISPAASSSCIIDTANQFILDLQTKPSDALPLDSLTVGYVKDRISEMMQDILHRSIAQACEVISKVAQRKCDRLNAGENQPRSSVCSRRSEAAASRNMPDRKRRSKVSIGPTSIVAQYEASNSTLKKCKDRPPTPITSVTSLVTCTMQETELDRRITSMLEISFEAACELEQRIRSDDYPLIHVMYSQRRYLEGNLLKYRMIIQPYVDQRVLASIEVDQLTVDERKWCGVSKDRLLHQTAIGLLKFPDGNQQYAKAMLDCINYLTVQATNQAQQILNDP
ncbi:uncharacterized protein LOC126578994 [Anopheles aquasalis]|uniref:uncharacterized protein LOC126578994 n=1 Tax=Anopheles aquasalis TaxID=42839 RepID=UPI00215A99F2|nr:uncharacterized protein LOC126578994 [Anopheles aquasalis]